MSLKLFYCSIILQFLSLSLLAQSNGDLVQADVELKGKSVKFRLGANFGYSINTGTQEKISEEYDSYVSDLNKGYFGGANLAFEISPDSYLGLKYSRNQSSAEMDIALEQYGILYTGKVRDVVNNSLYAMSYAEDLNYSLGTFSYSIFVGAMQHLDYGIILGDPIEITGLAAALGFELTQYFWITDYSAISVQIAYVLSNLQSYDITYGDATESVDLPNDEAISLGRFEFSLGLNFGN